MSNLLSSPNEIENWHPPCLADFLGNDELKKALASHWRQDGDGTNLLVEGDTGTAKTSMVEVYLKTRNCPNVTDPMSGPCGSCMDCKAFDDRFDDVGVFACFRTKVVKGGNPTHIFRVNCSDLSEHEVENLANEIAYFKGDRRIVHLDEFQEIQNAKIRGALQGILRQKGTIWIATGITAENLGPMFVRRFAMRTETTLPCELDLARFLRNRCDNWGISWDANETLARLAFRSHRNVAECLNVLAKAAGTENRKLTRPLVEQHRFISGIRITTLG